MIYYNRNKTCQDRCPVDVAAASEVEVQGGGGQALISEEEEAAAAAAAW